MGQLIAYTEHLDNWITATFNQRQVFIGTIILLLLVSLAARIWLVHKRAQLHIDETYSFVIALSGRDLYFSTDFLEHRSGQWVKAATIHRSLFTLDLARNGYVIDLLSHYKKIYWATAKDTHPPLYFFFLAIPFIINDRISAISTDDLFSGYKWLGTSLNFIFFVFSSLIFIKLAQLILKDNLAVITAYAFFALSLASLSIFIMIRMYELQILWCLYLSYLIFSNFNKHALNYKCFGIYSLVSTLAILTHYFSLIFIFFLCCIIAWQYLIVTKNMTIVVKYAAGTVAAIVLAIAVFPPLTEHLFGYRSTEALSKVIYIQTNLVPKLTAMGMMLNAEIITQYTLFAILIGIVPVLVIYAYRIYSSKSWAIRGTEKLNFGYFYLFLLSFVCFSSLVFLAPYNIFRFVAPSLPFFYLLLTGMTIGLITLVNHKLPRALFFLIVLISFTVLQSIGLNRIVLGQNDLDNFSKHGLFAEGFYADQVPVIHLARWNDFKLLFHLPAERDVLFDRFSRETLDKVAQEQKNALLIVESRYVDDNLRDNKLWKKADNLINMRGYRSFYLGAGT